MFPSNQLRKAVALCVVATWALLVGLSFADTIEDTRKVSAREDNRDDQAVQEALLTPAVTPVALSSKLITPHPAFELGHYVVTDVLWGVPSAASRLLASTLHDPPLLHRVKLFQLFSVYRL